MMAKMLVYAYHMGVFSSRKLEKPLVEDIAFRVLAAGNEPDFRTISEFCRIQLKAWKVCLCRCCSWQSNWAR